MMDFISHFVDGAVVTLSLSKGAQRQGGVSGCHPELGEGRVQGFDVCVYFLEKQGQRYLGQVLPRRTPVPMNIGMQAAD
ncbi:hypothetical protein [Mucilaginibacter sp.]|uniref:hypothetical protein n=1 Tax=Mucilaginibacter sp. TaxID=1882438 RepID=UPI00326703AF